MKRIVILISIIILSTIYPAYIDAEEFAVGIAPQEYHIVSKKGQTITLPYTLTNVGDPTVLELKAYTLFQKDSQGTYDIIPASQSKDTKAVIFATDNPDLTLEKPFLFQSQKTYPLTLSIQLPDDIVEKDYYFMLVAESQEQKGFRTSSSLLINGAVGSVIYVSVTENGSLLRVPQLVLFDTKLENTLHMTIGSYTIVNSGEPIPVILSLVNGGRNLFFAEGNVIYDGLFSKKLNDTEIESRIQKLNENTASSKEETVFPLVKSTILANSQKNLKASYDPLCNEEKKNGCDSEHSVLLPGHFIGAYRITADIKTDSVEMPAITSEKYIIFFPYYLLLFVGIGIILLSLLNGSGKKR